MKARLMKVGLAAFLSLIAAAPYAADERKAANESVAAHYRHADEHTSGAGRPGNPSAAVRSVKVLMLETLRYEPRSIYVNRGETVRFVIENKDKLVHEFHINGAERHDEIIQQKADMEHGDPKVVTVGPGETKELAWQFSKRGTFEIYCHVAGHSAAGMKMTVTAAN